MQQIIRSQSLGEMQFNVFYAQTVEIVFIKSFTTNNNLACSIVLKKIYLNSWGIPWKLNEYPFILYMTWTESILWLLLHLDKFI